MSQGILLTKDITYTDIDSFTNWNVREKAFHVKTSQYHVVIEGDVVHFIKKVILFLMVNSFTVKGARIGTRYLASLKVEVLQAENIGRRGTNAL